MPVPRGKRWSGPIPAALVEVSLPKREGTSPSQVCQRLRTDTSTIMYRIVYTIAATAPSAITAALSGF